MNPCKIRINNEDHSKAVQEYLREQGVYDTVLPLLNGEVFIFVHTDIPMVTWSKSIDHFEAIGLPELDLNHLDPHLKPKGNSLALLRQAQEHLREAENAYENATFELEKAKEGHRVALEAFKEEAEGVIGDSEEMPEMPLKSIHCADMSDPQNWLPGDLVKVTGKDTHGFQVHQLVKILDPLTDDGSGIPAAKCEDDEDYWWVNHVNLKWHSRPIK